jgi:DNA-binding ferritin-like protein (Dps family)
MNYRELKKLKKKLPKNYYKILGKRMGMHPNSIYRHLFSKKNKTIRQDILDEAIRLAEETQNSKEKASEKISKL